MKPRTVVAKQVRDTDQLQLILRHMMIQKVLLLVFGGIMMITLSGWWFLAIIVLWPSLDNDKKEE